MLRPVPSERFVNGSICRAMRLCLLAFVTCGNGSIYRAMRWGLLSFLTCGTALQAVS